MPLKDTPDYQDADLVLRLYDMRREAVMRESRKALIAGWVPATQEECLAITSGDHPLNAAYRQCSTYWEMAYGLVKHGIVHGDYMLESNGEGLLIYSRVEPWLAALREKSGPFAFANAEWVATHTERGKVVAARFRARQQAVMAKAAGQG
ncbi:MAG: hypothetical protein KJT01_12520 [Gemmatimonadetes bacterium]|nr:hypothetical protein [Gemmatimonadota bacterium]